MAIIEYATWYIGTVEFKSNPIVRYQAWSVQGKRIRRIACMAAYFVVMS